MTVTCPQCGQPIVPASINVAQDVALCASCGEVFKVSALLTAPQQHIPPYQAQGIPYQSVFATAGRTKSKAIPIAIASAIVVIIAAFVLILRSAPEEDYDPYWTGYENYASFSTAFDFNLGLDELLGFPVEELLFKFLASLGQGYVSVDPLTSTVFDWMGIEIETIGGTDLGKLYRVASSLRTSCPYLVRKAQNKDEKTYVAFFDGENWHIFGFPAWLTEEEFAAPQTAVVQENPQAASQPASGSVPPVSASFAGAEYSGTMIQDRTVLNIQMVIGGFKDGEAVNTYYLYIEQDIPIPLTGSLDGEELILLEAEDSGFFFPHFDPAYTLLTGMWTGSSGDYAVTLTRK